MSQIFAHNLTIPRPPVSADGEAVSHLKIQLHYGDCLFVVGPNGSGKSALLQYFNGQLPGRKPIPAYRQNWMQSSIVDLSLAQRRQIEVNYQSHQGQPQARYLDGDPYGHYITASALFDLVDSGDRFAHAARAALVSRASNLEELEEKFGDHNTPVDRINRVLAAGSLKVQIELGDNRSVLAKKGGPAFTAVQLSDGERNALILSCHILCADEKTVFLIDEPEQHLHRAIAAPLLTTLIAERRDCAFIVFTHEISLPESMRESKVLVLHNCYWDDNGNQPVAWDCNLLHSEEEVPDTVKRAILGGRERVLFVEGGENSLDRIYAELYPRFTVHPIGNSTQVRNAVKALRKSEPRHWVKACGIIDNDGRPDAESKKMRKEGITVLSESSVESLFYCSDVRAAIAKMKAVELGVVEKELLAKAKSGALSALAAQKACEHLAARRCDLEIAYRAKQKLPNHRDISGMDRDSIKIEFPSPYRDELARLQTLIQEEELDEVIARYPVRESGVLQAIAKAFEYRNRALYEQAVLQCVRADAQLQETLRAKIPLPDTGGGE